MPCNPNKILIATTQTLRPHKRILPIGFQTGYRTGANGIGEIIQTLDSKVAHLCDFNSDAPRLVPLETVLDLFGRSSRRCISQKMMRPPLIGTEPERPSHI